MSEKDRKDVSKILSSLIDCKDCSFPCCGYDLRRRLEGRHYHEALYQSLGCEHFEDGECKIHDEKPIVDCLLYPFFPVQQFPAAVIVSIGCHKARRLAEDCALDEKVHERVKKKLRELYAITREYSTSIRTFTDKYKSYMVIKI